MAEKPTEQASGSDWELRWGLLVADAWADDALKKRLLSDPAAVLKERGITTPPNVQIKTIEDTANVMHLVLPMKPAEAELSEEELSTVAGGHCHGGGCGGMPWLPWLWRWLWLLAAVAAAVAVAAAARPPSSVRRPLCPVGLRRRRDRDPQLDLSPPVLSLGPGVTVAGDLSVVPASSAGPTDPSGGLNRNGGWVHDAPPGV